MTALRSAMRLGPPSHETGGEEVPSIAVLPFADMSPDKAQEYFCDGLADDIINALSHLGGLRVVSRSSAFTFKDKVLDVREIGKKLNASTVLEGSVRKSGATVRVTAQLVSVEDGFQLWSDKFDREMRDVFAIQDEISMAIVENLKPRLMIGERDRVLERHTQDIGAYNHYLKGRWFWDKRTESALKKAIYYFKLAADKDPNYSQAYAGLADAYSDLPTYSSYPPSSAYPKAKEAALRAIEIDESHAEPHASLGLIKTDYEWDWEGAERELKRAIELNPNYSTAHHWYSILFMWLGRWQEAIAEIERAFELDPLCLVTSRSKGMVLSVAGSYDEAVEVLQHTLELEPGFVYTRLLLGQTYLRKRAFDKALAEFISEREVVGSQSPYLESWIGVAYALMRDEESARMALRKIKGMSNTKYVPPFQIGMLHLVLGEKDPGFRFLSVAFSERDVWMRTLRVRQPFFPESVRTDRRMIGLLQKMRFST